MIYYNSRYLSEKLGINLAKWKRWSREFLDPDPLGGLQSGVTRQYSLRDAFKVYFGGYLVNTLKFTIPEALTIISDLTPWLRANGFFSLDTKLRQSDQSARPIHHLYICTLGNLQFAYAIRTIIRLDKGGQIEEQQTELYSVALINANTDPLSVGICTSAEVVVLSVLYNRFCKQIMQ